MINRLINKFSTPITALKALKSEKTHGKHIMLTQIMINIVEYFAIDRK